MYPNCFEDVAKGIPIFNNERVTYHCVRLYKFARSHSLSTMKSIRFTYLMFCRVKTLFLVFSIRFYPPKGVDVVSKPKNRSIINSYFKRDICLNKLTDCSCYYVYAQLRGCF